MRQQEVHEFLLRFFEANHCPITEHGPGFMTVQLTVEMDKQIMNRPFYWHWREKTGGEPNPMKITFGGYGRRIYLLWSPAPLSNLSSS